MPTTKHPQSHRADPDKRPELPTPPPTGGGLWAPGAIGPQDAAGWKAEAETFRERLERVAETDESFAVRELAQDIIREADAAGVLARTRPFWGRRR